RPYFSMELLPGGSLADRLGASRLPPRDAAALLATLARAIQAAHERGVVHRDLKPANILFQVADSGQAAVPKISDFWLAKLAASDAGRTQSGAVAGTPCYMAPEQAGGRSGAVGPAADVHALGTILYEILTGRPPFQGATVLETLAEVLGREPKPPGRITPGV